MTTRRIGSVTVTHNGTLLTLQNDQLIEGVAVSGTLELAPDPISLDGQAVTAKLTAKAPGIRDASFTATWTTAGADSTAEVSGAIGKLSLAGSLPAP